MAHELPLYEQLQKLRTYGKLQTLNGITKALSNVRKAARGKIEREVGKYGYTSKEGVCFTFDSWRVDAGLL